MIKLIALDMDGTTLNCFHKISQENKDAIARAREQGVIVTVATGRMLRAVAPFIRELNIEGPFIAYNGAVTAEAPSGRLLSELTLDKQTAVRLFEIARQNGVTAQCYINDSLVTDRINAAMVYYAGICKVPIKAVGDSISFLQAQDKAPVKVLFTAPPERITSLWEQVASEFGKDIYITRSTPYFLEMLNINGGKGARLREIAALYGVKQDEIMVCGDSLNDLELFSAGGLKIAMANAEPALKEQADHITLSNDDHGVAAAIEKFILK